MGQLRKDHNHYSSLMEAKLSLGELLKLQLAMPELQLPSPSGRIVTQEHEEHESFVHVLSYPDCSHRPRYL